MSLQERTGFRSSTFSHWHRVAFDEWESMIDIDYIKYCDGCRKPLLLIEEAAGLDQTEKQAWVTGGLAELAHLVCLCVLYERSKDSCRCQSSRRDPGCDHGISRFKVRRVHVPPGHPPFWPVREPLATWQSMTPREFMTVERTIRRSHYATCSMWQRRHDADTKWKAYL